MPRSWCGNSYHTIFLEPGECWEVAAPRYAGAEPTELRFRLTMKLGDFEVIGQQLLGAEEFANGVSMTACLHGRLARSQMSLEVRKLLLLGLVLGDRLLGGDLVLAANPLDRQGAHDEAASDPDCDLQPDDEGDPLVNAECSSENRHEHRRVCGKRDHCAP